MLQEVKNEVNKSMLLKVKQWLPKEKLCGRLWFQGEWINEDLSADNIVSWSACILYSVFNYLFYEN